METLSDPQPPTPPGRPPLQFGLRALLTAPVAVGLLFGVLRWLDVPPLASVVVLAVLIVSVAAAAALIAAIAGGTDA